MSGNYDIKVLPICRNSDIVPDVYAPLAVLGWLALMLAAIRQGKQGKQFQTDCSVYAMHNMLRIIITQPPPGGGGAGAQARRRRRLWHCAAAALRGGGGSRLVIVLEAKSRPFRHRRRGVPRGDHQAFLPVRRVFVFFPCPYQTKFGVPAAWPKTCEERLS
jgi:hypothetical protein